jgi:hypothetical protein
VAIERQLHFLNDEKSGGSFTNPPDPENAAGGDHS